MGADSSGIGLPFFNVRAAAFGIYPFFRTMDQILSWVCLLAALLPLLFMTLETVEMETIEVEVEQVEVEVDEDEKKDG